VAWLAGSIGGGVDIAGEGDIGCDWFLQGRKDIDYD
jgi:hypothetical protein